MIRNYAFPLLLLQVLPASAIAQCDVITVGQYDGTPVSGNANTPFATNTGSNNRRGNHVQYIYPASELLAAGMCAGPITKVSFQALGSDIGTTAGADGLPGTPDDVPGAEIRVDLRLGHTDLNDFGPYIASSMTPLAVDWDAAETAPNIHENTFIAMLVEGGPFDLELSAGGFAWDGVSNLVLDLSWMRAATIGLSPAVELEEDLPYTATKWVQVTAGSNVNHGNTYQDNPLTMNATTGTTQNRPVTTFHGLSTAVSPVLNAPAMQVYADASTSELVITRTGSANGSWPITCSDAAGRIIAQATLASGSNTLRVPLEHRPTGIILVTALGTAGQAHLVGRVVCTW